MTNADEQNMGQMGQMGQDEQTVSGHSEEQGTGAQATAPQGETPAELRDVLPQLSGEVDEDEVLDAEEEEQEAGQGQPARLKDENGEEYEEEFIDADDLLGLLGEMKEMLEAQGKEIRGLRREMRELRESQGQGGFRGGDRGGQGGFRPREDRGGFGDRDRGGDRGGFRPREDRGERSFGGDRGGQGGFRPREDRNFGDREFRPRTDDAQGTQEGGFRPRARADRGWANRRTDEE